MRGNNVIVAGAPLGAWLLAAPFVVYESMLAPNFWNDIAIGIAVLLLAAYGVGCSLCDRPVSIAAGGLVGVLGLWQVTRVFAVSTAGPLPLWGDAVVGVLLAALGGRAVREARTARMPDGRTSQR